MRQLLDWTVLRRSREGMDVSGSEERDASIQIELSDADLEHVVGGLERPYLMDSPASDRLVE